MLGARLAEFLARPLCKSPIKLPALERWLQIDLMEHDYSALEQACDLGGVKLGAYYHWYLQKKLIAKNVREADRDKIFSIIRGMDRTNYKALNDALSEDKGTIIAIPHHGHYILSIIGMMENFRANHDVYVFYGDPTTHPGNEVFDELAERLFSFAGSRAYILHSDRSGVATALRALNNGGIVFMMPDVFKHREETFTLPFYGKPLSVMLGTASMARKTDTTIIPAVSVPGPGLTFTTVTGSSLEKHALNAPHSNQLNSDYRDYAATVDMFAFYEYIVGGDILYWQFIRSHLRKTVKFPEFPPDEFSFIWENFLQDPRTSVNLSGVIQLDGIELMEQQK